jgi:hypothetical protein
VTPATTPSSKNNRTRHFDGWQGKAANVFFSVVISFSGVFQKEQILWWAESKSIEAQSWGYRELQFLIGRPDEKL